MFRDSTAPAAEVSAADLEGARRAKLCPFEQIDTVTYDWSQIGVGILAAGGAYPLVVGAMVVAIVIASSLWNGFEGVRLDGILSAGIGIVMYSAAAGLFGVLWSMFVATLTLPVIFLFVRSLNFRASIVHLGAFSGGVVGFICTLPLSLQLPWYSVPSDSGALVLFALGGPGLATVLGQLGGAWGGSKSRAAGPKISAWKKYALGPAVVTLPNPSTVDPPKALEPTKSQFRFGIRHLLWVSVWLSLLLSLIRVCGIPYELMLPLLGGWLVFQWFTLRIGGRLVRRLGPWWGRRRQFRST